MVFFDWFGLLLEKKGVLIWVAFGEEGFASPANVSKS